MGGEREATVSLSKVIDKQAVVGDVRIHEANKEVHFHADSSKIKVAIPSAIWFQAWMKLMDQGGSFSYVDAKRGTTVIVEVTITDSADKAPSIDAKLTTGKIEVGDTFKTLHEFTVGK